MEKTALLSNDGVYRYRLTRRFEQPGRLLPFLMLNPSIADADIDDPTIRRCIGFARELGFAGIVVSNLYAFRATKPKDLWKAADPIGPDNSMHLHRLFGEAAAQQSPVIAAWGVNAKPERVEEILQNRYANLLVCLGKTQDGHPKHPLYLPKGAQLVSWP